jgi:hypothetical protein
MKFTNRYTEGSEGKSYEIEYLRKERKPRKYQHGKKKGEERKDKKTRDVFFLVRNGFLSRGNKWSNEV